MGVLVWMLKPKTVVPGETVYEEIRIPADSSEIIQQALQGMEVGTYAEMVKKFGKTVFKTVTKDSLNIVDSLRITDSTIFHIPTLSLSDTFDYSGFDLLNGDTAKVRLRVRTDALALLSPVNAIQIKTAIEDLTITVPPRPDPSSLDLAYKYWRELGLFGITMFLLGVLQ